MTKQIETNALPLAEALIDTIDDEEGYPSVVDFFGANCGISREDAEAWVANPQGDPPPGVTSTWAVVSHHPTNPARHAVPVTDDLMTRIVGLQPSGWAQAIQAQNATERGSDWFQ